MSYLGKQAIEWAKASPDDPRVPEALFIAVQANQSFKYGCNSWEFDAELKAEAEKLLRERYPESPWTAKLADLNNLCAFVANPSPAPQLMDSDPKPLARVPSVHKSHHTETRRLANTAAQKRSQASRADPRRKRVTLHVRIQHSIAIVITSVEHQLNSFALQLATTDPN